MFSKLGISQKIEQSTLNLATPEPTPSFLHTPITSCRASSRLSQKDHHSSFILMHLKEKTPEVGKRERPLLGDLIVCRQRSADGSPADHFIWRNRLVRPAHISRGRPLHIARTPGLRAQMSISQAREDKDEAIDRNASFQTRIGKVPSDALKAVKIFPWEKACTRFIQRTGDLIWVVARWLGIPFLALSTLSEIVYTLAAKKDVCILLGMAFGVVISRVAGKSTLEALKEAPEKQYPWPLIVMVALFLMLKLLGPLYPSRAAVFLPHVASAGLVQTMLIIKEWQKMPLRYSGIEKDLRTGQADAM